VRILPVMVCAGLALLAGCPGESAPPADALVLPEDFECAGGAPGWKRAVAISPDVVPPCDTGSTGTCDGFGYTYVVGTGWCRPI